MPKGGDPVHSVPRKRERERTASVLAVLLVAELLALMVFLVPVMGAANSPAPGGVAQVPVFGWSIAVDRSTVLVVVSLVGGALGGTLHAVASLTEHLAADDFDRRWTTWYLTHPFVGAAVAVVFSFVLNVSVGGQPASTAQGGSYGIAAVATLSGLFSRHALEKLKEIFDVVVGGRSATDATGAEGTRNGSPDGGETSHGTSHGTSHETPGEIPAVPRIVGLSPSSVAVASDDPPLTITGSGFAPDSVVDVNGTRVPASVGPELIVLRLPSVLVAGEGELAVRVRSHGVWSNAAELEVLP